MAFTGPVHALVFERNIAQVAGEILSPEIGLPCIDEVSLSELDFIDIGARLADEDYVPIVIKSLVFDCWGCTFSPGARRPGRCATLTSRLRTEAPGSGTR